MSCFLTTLLPVKAETFSNQAHRAFSGSAQEDTGSFPPSLLVTAEVLKAKIAESEVATEVTADTKTELLTLYHKALSNLEVIDANTKRTVLFEDAVKTSTVEMPAQDGPSIPAADESLEANLSSPLREAEQLLEKEKADLAATSARRANIEKRLEYETGRPLLIRQRLTEVRKQQQEAAERLKHLPPVDANPAVAQARQWVLQTSYQALSSEIRMLDQELLSHPSRVGRLEAEWDKVAATVGWIGERLGVLEDLVTQKRQEAVAQAQALADMTRREAEGKHPLVVRLAERNAALSEEVAGTVSGQDQLAEQTKLVEIQARRTEEDFKSARETIEIGGLSQELGHMLYQQRAVLPDPRSFRREASEREDQATQFGVRRLGHRQEQRRLRDLDGYITATVAKAAIEETPVLRSQLSDLATERQRLLAKAVESYDFLLRKLGELESAQWRLLDAVEAYDGFLNVHLLWVRTTSPANLRALGALPTELARILSPSGWLGAIRTLIYQVTHSPALIVLALVFGALLWSREWFITAIRSVRSKLAKPTTDHIGYTLRVLGLSLLAAAAWPLLVAVTGWQLQITEEGASYSRALGGALLAIAGHFFFLRVFYVVCIPDGLAAAHFRWPESSLDLLRGELNRLSWIFLPATMFAIFAFYLDPTNIGGPIGRAGTLVAFGTLTVAFYRLLHPARGILAGYLHRREGGAVKRLSWLWYSVLVGTPVALGLLAMMGYVYTSVTLLTLMLKSSWMLVSLIIFAAVAQRWLRVAQRRLTYEAAMEEQRAKAEGESEHGPTHAGGEGAGIEFDEPEIDLEALSETSQKLLNTAIAVIGLIGLWMLWSEVLPAFRIFDDLVLWHKTVTVDGVDLQLPTTLGNLILALVYVLATVILTKQLPAVLEIVLMHNTEMSTSSRYTVTTLTSYVIVTVGLVLALNLVGVDWSKLQWLVAALGVGIGFGLQEIVANFISGIIILFERPVRVGDAVTVGDTDGIVTRIRIRATTVRNWDGKELLVPNKEFITGRVLNWSLSDQTTRILIAVGITYGSNVRQAMDLLDQAARENRNVLTDPSPSVLFQGFGDNALNMVLRCFVETVDLRVTTISALNEAINEKFNEAGIVIAFPQQDVHLNTNGPLRISIEDGAGIKLVGAPTGRPVQPGEQTT